jgi:hypothetical protein
MKCAHAQLLFSEAQRGDLDPALKPEFEAHLAGCGACTEAFAAFVAFHGALRNERAGAPSEHYWNSLLPRIHERIDASQKRRLFGFSPVWLQRLALVSAAVAGLIFLVHVVPVNVHETTADLASVIAPMPTAQLQQISERESLENPEAVAQTSALLEPSDSGVSTDSTDQQYLMTILQQEDSVYSSSDFDADQTVLAFNDQEQEDLVMHLQHNSTAK